MVYMESKKVTPEDHYRILSNEMVECIYCKSFVNLHNIKKHCRGKKCTELKHCILKHIKMNHLMKQILNYI